MTDIKTEKTMLFNPYTGKPRHPSDIASDPAGKLMIDPDMPLLAASAPAQEPFKWCLRIVRPQEHNYATNDLYNTEAEADAARVHASKHRNNVSVFPLYAAPVDAQDAVDAKRYRRLREGFGDLGPEIDIHNAFVDGGEKMDKAIDDLIEKEAALQASQSAQDQVKEK